MYVHILCSSGIIDKQRGISRKHTSSRLKDKVVDSFVDSKIQQKNL